MFQQKNNSDKEDSDNEFELNVNNDLNDLAILVVIDNQSFNKSILDNLRENEKNPEKIDQLINQRESTNEVSTAFTTQNQDISKNK